MAKKEAYALTLRQTPEADWVPYLLKESGLPGPRGNLELVQAAADEGTREQFLAWMEFTPERTPPDTPYEFLPVCAAVGLGRLLTDGQETWLASLHALAADPRWRVREAVAMALQRLGLRDMPRLLRSVDAWVDDGPLEMRAAAAAVCEPALLRVPEQTARVLRILDRITTHITEMTDRKSDAFKALRKGMAYCWSVAVAANPETGKPLFEHWLACADPDVRWVMKENLKKNRLMRMDAAWVERLAAQH
jgi:hypothetical protein